MFGFLNIQQLNSDDILSYTYKNHRGSASIVIFDASGICILYKSHMDT